MNPRIFFALSLTCIASSSFALDKLASYNIDPQEISVSGVSSGAYMAMQYQSVFSSTTKGAGIIAGGPYHCYGENTSGDLNEAQMMTCMRGNPNATASIEKIKANAAAKLADSPDHLKSQRVYLFIGGLDSFVGEPVMDSVHDYYKAFIPEEQITYSKDKDTGHAFLTDNPAHARCGNNGLPGVNNCGFDQAGDILQWIYQGKLAPRKTGKLDGKIVAFDQGEFYGKVEISLEKSGYLYVPTPCDKGEKCKLHIVFHGCGQSAGYIEDKIYSNDGAGFNRWADANNMIVLYPQVGISYVKPANQYGCWDWWGYTSPQWDTNQGKQLQVIRAMVDRLLGKNAGR